MSYKPDYWFPGCHRLCHRENIIGYTSLLFSYIFCLFHKALWTENPIVELSKWKWSLNKLFVTVVIFSSYYKIRIIPKNENRHAFTLFPPLPISTYASIFSTPCVLSSLNHSVQSFAFWFSNTFVFLGLICPMLFCRHFYSFYFFQFGFVLTFGTLLQGSLAF